MKRLKFMSWVSLLERRHIMELLKTEGFVSRLRGVFLFTNAPNQLLADHYRNHFEVRQ